MPVYSWLCRTELDRERMVGTVRWLGPARAAMFAILTGVLLGSAHDTGWWALAPLAICVVVSVPLYRNLENRKRPEFWAAGGWLTTQTTLAIGVALTGGPHSPALPWFAVGVISLVARFSREGIVAGLVVLFLLLVAVTFGYAPAQVWTHPQEFLYPVGLLFSVWVFAAAQMRSDLDHRDYDKTTGLPNQAKFVDDLRLAASRRLRRGGAIGILAIDLDGFGLANEGLGPRAGDALLRQAGSRIARGARGADLVARRSADEFLVFLSALGGEHGPGSHAAGTTMPQLTTAIARAIQAEFAEPFVLGEDEVYLDVCVGVSVLEDGEEDAIGVSERLLSEAQNALSAARTGGPGTLQFFRREHSASRAQLTLISRLRRALERNQFVMHYQPTVNLHTGQMIGVEALLRWNDPERGLILPGEFIGVAEESGLIDDIGRSAFTEVCRQAGVWQRGGHVFDVAYNLSPRQLHQPDLLPWMLATVRSHGVDPARLVIEITESSALEDPERSIRMMAAMRQHGMRLAIDDFGVGLSSLSRLRDMPATFLKIDRSFVSALDSSPNGIVMIKTTVQLAENLGMVPHVEGVETQEQRRVLLELGCVQGQGFLFSRAIPAPDLLEFDARSRQAALIGLPAPAHSLATSA